MDYKRTDPNMPDDNVHSDNDRLSAHDKGISALLTDSLTGVLKNDVDLDDARSERLREKYGFSALTYPTPSLLPRVCLKKGNPQVRADFASVQGRDPKA